VKKILFIAMALVVALGGLGIGYARWTDTVTISGPIQTGSVCLAIEPRTYGEINTCPPSPFATLPDLNWSGWIKRLGNISCPMGYTFADKPCSDKDVASMSFHPIDLDGDGNFDVLEITINNAYPHFLGHITFEVCNCGTVPVKIKAPAFDQSPFLVIEYRNGVGEQLEPGVCHEISLFVGTVQHMGYWLDGVVGGTWIVDDPQMPLLPIDTPLTFTIEVEAVQWDQF